MATELPEPILFIDDELVELKKLEALVLETPDAYGPWEQLVHAAETQEGGLNRNSAPQALQAIRSIYDAFLAKFPLFFGYWKKYADLEFQIAGTETAEMIYERGVASISNSVDLWKDYCAFKITTCHDNDEIRDSRITTQIYRRSTSRTLERFEFVQSFGSNTSQLLFERGASCVGLDFLAHPFWDKYLEFEERANGHAEIFAILSRIIHIPMHQYARYFERFRSLTHLQPIHSLALPELLQQFQAEVFTEDKSEAQYDREMRAIIDQYHLQIFSNTQAETTKRWTFEQAIKRPYFHVTDLEENELENWRNYLDFEVKEGNYARAVFLYERCLVSCAYYSEFWLRFANALSHSGTVISEEEARIVYQRAACLYAPIHDSSIRLQYALFEEKHGRVDVARGIHEAILIYLPGHVDTIVSWANLERRHGGVDAATAVYKHQVEALDSTWFHHAKGELVTAWATLLWKGKGAPGEARALYKNNAGQYHDVPKFWKSWLKFEIDQAPEVAGVQDGKAVMSTDKADENVRVLWKDFQSKATVGHDTGKEMGRLYLEGFVLPRGGGTGAEEYLELNARVYGPLPLPAREG